MSLLNKKNRNAALARDSFVTKRAETKLSALAELFSASAGAYCKSTEAGKLTRTLRLDGLGCLDNLSLIYNWENRFMSVNYDLQLKSVIRTGGRFAETGSMNIHLDYSSHSRRWVIDAWSGTAEERDKCLGRLSNPLIMERFKTLDIFAVDISHVRDSGTFEVSMESMIGSATWILIPPIMTVASPTPGECLKFYELFGLIGDALINNRT